MNLVPKPKIRFAILRRDRDLKPILEIEQLSFDFPWDAQTFTQHTQQKTPPTFCMVATENDQIRGYAVYALHRYNIELLNLAVHPHFRRTGIATALVHKLLGKLSPLRRHALVTSVAESNLQALAFLRHVGLRWLHTEHKPFAHSDDDAYLLHISTRSRQLRLLNAKWLNATD